MLDALEDRFRAPPGWTTGLFTNAATGHSIHYGWVSPANPKAVVVGLGGLSEFSEKYFELAHDMVARGYAFWTMDWAYQGRSGRMAAPYTHRRHSDGYENDVADLHDLITRFIRPSSPAPLLLIAHSMGGNIGLRYLSTHTETFRAAALSAPFLGIKKITGIDKILLAILRRLTPDNYVPGGKDWQEKSRKSDGSDIFSSDPLRDKIHNAYSLADDILQIGSPTIRWVYESLQSSAVLAAPGTLEKIQIPVLVAMAGRDDIVSNKDIRAAASRLKAGRLLVLDGARHEILMEKDEYRGAFLNGFDKMLEDYKIAP